MSRIVFFDVETTGVGDEDRLVELAYKVQGAPEGVVGRFKPPVPMTAGASSVCGITAKDLEDKEPFIGSLMHKDMIEFAGDPDTIFVAHNAAFDIKFLRREGIDITRHICTLKVAHHHDKEGKLEQHKLQFLRYQYELDVAGEAHSALGDVLVLEALFDFYATSISEARMLALSERPILMKKWPNFGKWKNTPMSLIPPDYLRWCAGNIKMSEDLAYTVQRWTIHHQKLQAEYDDALARKEHRGL